MKLDKLEIQHFAKPEYTHSGPIRKRDIASRDLLIRGPNQSGKTLTFNAILYCMLGDTIDLRRGHGNEVEIDFDEGSTFQRGEQGRYYWTSNGQKLEGKDAAAKLQEKLGPEDHIKRHFLHSHIDRLPLESLSRSRLVDLILSVSDSNVKDELESARDRSETLSEELGKVGDQIDSLEREKSRKSRQKYQIGGQVERWQTVLDLAEDGKLREISQLLREKPEIEKELNELSSERRGLRQKMSEAKNELNLAEDYEQEVKEIIGEALKEFICPVCEDRVGSDTAMDRWDKDLCPFCRQDSHLDDLEKHIRSKKNATEGRSEELREEIKQYEDRIDEIDERMAELEKQQESLSGINDTAINVLEKYNHEIGEIRSVARERVRDAEAELADTKKDLERIKSELKEAEQERDDLKEEKKRLSDKIFSLEQEDASTEIINFQEKWNEHYHGIAPDIAFQFEVTNEGRILLPDAEGGRRHYDRRGDLSDAELYLLNISFALTLNDILVENGTTSWQAIVLDEPFTQLDDENKNRALEYLQDQDQQIILTSSDNYVLDAFGAQQSLTLERRDFRQTELTNDW